jgi:aspartyl-tRNA(Asn)/glutamyl-tRNA(Gln) amidotransferase subunit A
LTTRNSDINFASVAELAPRIRSGDLSPVDLVHASLDRITQLNPKLNAFLKVWGESALRDARNAEKAIASGGYLGPLHGIPIGIKDLIDVAGEETTGGSAVLAGNIADSDATIIANLKAAGAILIGKLNLNEFAFGVTGTNSHTGDVKNPWDTTRVTGGSSSGSGAAVASGMVPLALGTDTGGSVRLPASLCGIAGLKPTYGRVSRAGVLDLSWSMDHVGPMTRSSEDCALLLNVLAGHDPRDPASSEKSVPDFTSIINKGVNGLKIGVPSDYFFDDAVDNEIVASVVAAIELMAQNGAEIIDIPMPWTGLGRTINLGVIKPEVVAVHEQMLAEHADLYTPATRSRIQSGYNISAVDYLRAQGARQWFSHQMAESMKSIDVLITPSSPIQTPTIADCMPTPGKQIVGGELAMFTGVFDTTGQPSHSIPCGFTENGMPIGMMITGHPFDEATVLRVGNSYENLTNWHQRPPADTPATN